MSRYEPTMTRNSAQYEHPGFQCGVELFFPYLQTSPPSMRFLTGISLIVTQTRVNVAVPLTLSQVPGFSLLPIDTMHDACFALVFSILLVREENNI